MQNEAGRWVPARLLMTSVLNSYLNPAYSKNDRSPCVDGEDAILSRENA